MKEFNKFYFKSFEFDKANLKAKFHYSFDNEVFFEELIDFENKNFKVTDINDEYLNSILFHLHIALWISYYKAFPTKELLVKSWYLDDYQIDFWKKFYTNWLWEFLYTNKISPKWLFKFKNTDNSIIYKSSNTDSKQIEKSLVPIWWWKDSIVTIELLKKSWIDFDLFVFWKIDELKQFTSDISWKNVLQVKRELSQELFRLNNEWYYNWHVPITWIIAFVMEVVAYLYWYKYLVLSNEKSANFWNTKWEGVDINHQYSKSLEFEKDLELYVEKYISKEIKYFSLLRWLYEIKIAELFAKFWKKYFWKFSSCNNNFKILTNKEPDTKKTYWCNNCPKCAFVFSIIRPYLSTAEVQEIFWEDLYERKDLEKLFRELLWISWIKPFECVWEAEEVIYSMYETIEKQYKNSKNLPFILDIFKKELLNKFDTKNIKNIEKKLVTIYNDDIIPTQLKNIIFKKIS